ncbi:hypothetical protein [Escherichia coli]|uniref:hypothetical protein n=1 Tax=Escherichia coli TaxID=562 RepID=UPI0013028159|nr:hypothetical protein [Escherichia coli]KAE9756189.1 hypothetical protein GP701_12305 [Escherichia coli]MWL09258.1 hypothetical protein [Escherichia coli]MWL18232.1 hypothetical protein [Escherichia coli]MWL41835.1 hypothetical protein [Escherichia coli]MWL53270.1 hypothetical protein [Escherichia coli]
MAATTKDMVEIASAYTLIIHRLIDNNARDALNTIKPLSKARSDIISGLKSLQECARYAGDYATYMVINDAIERIESGKPLRAFV